MLSTVTWVNPFGGSWSNVGNWMDQAGVFRLPTAADDVVINQPGNIRIVYDAGNTSIASLTTTDEIEIPSGSLTIGTAGGTTSTFGSTLTIDGGTLLQNADAAVSSLNLSAGTLSGTGAVTVSGDFAWSGGSMTGAGSTVGQGTMELSGFSSKELTDRSLVNEGTATWTSSGFVFLERGATFDNRLGATFDIQSDSIFWNDLGIVGPQFDNEGTITRSTSTGTVTLLGAIQATNTGAIDVESGTLDINLNGGGLTSSGVLQADSGALLDLISGGDQLTDGAALKGAGAVQIDGATVTIAGAVTASSMFTLSSGTVTGTGTLTLTNSSQWTGGTMSGSGSTVNQGDLTISGFTSKDLTGRTLVNEKTTTWKDSGFFFLEGTAIFDNRLGATFDIQSDSNLWNDLGIPGPQLENEGTITRSTSTGTATLLGAIVATNTGTIDVESGTLDINLSGGSLTSSGILQADSGAILDLVFGNDELTDGSTLQGAGTVRIDGAAVTIAGAVAASTAFVLATGTVTGTGTLTLTGSSSWTGGTMSGTGSTVNQGDLTISGFSSKDLSGRTLVNEKTTTWKDSGFFFLEGTAIFDNRLGATFDIQSDSNLWNDLGIPGPQLENEGTITRSASTGTATLLGAIVVANTGTIDVESGTLDFNLNGGGLTSSGVLQADSGALLDLVSGNDELMGGASLQGTGTVQVDGATVTVAGAVTASSMFALATGLVTGAGTLTLTANSTWTGGTMSGVGSTVNQGSLTISGFSSKDLSGRTLVNKGTMTWRDTGFFFLENAATLDNRSGAAFDIEGDSNLWNDLGIPGPTIENEGILVKSAGSLTTVLGDLPITNTGTIEVDSGTLNLSANLTNFANQTLTGGTYIARNATLEFASADVRTAAANIVLDGPTASILDTSNQDGLRLLGTIAAVGSLTIEGTRSFNGGSLFADAGLLSVVSGSTFVAGRVAIASTDARLAGRRHDLRRCRQRRRRRTRRHAQRGRHAHYRRQLHAVQHRHAGDRPGRQHARHLRRPRRQRRRPARRHARGRPRRRLLSGIDGSPDRALGGVRFGQVRERPQSDLRLQRRCRGGLRPDRRHALRRHPRRTRRSGQRTRHDRGRRSGDLHRRPRIAADGRRRDSDKLRHADRGDTVGRFAHLHSGRLEPAADRHRHRRRRPGSRRPAEIPYRARRRPERRSAFRRLRSERRAAHESRQRQPRSRRPEPGGVADVAAVGRHADDLVDRREPRQPRRGAMDRRGHREEPRHRRHRLRSRRSPNRSASSARASA